MPSANILLPSPSGAPENWKTRWYTVESFFVARKAIVKPSVKLAPVSPVRTCFVLPSSSRPLVPSETRQSVSASSR